MTEAQPGDFVRAQLNRSRRRRRNKIIGLIIGLVLLVAIAAAIYLLWFSTLFRIQEVKVSGTELLTPDEVSETAGIVTGEPLISLDTSNSAARIGDLDAVAEVEVRRSFPTTVEIVVTERKLAYVRSHGTGFQWIDDQGVIFHTTAQRPPESILAETSSTDARLLSDVAVVVKNLPAEAAERLQVINAAAVDQIELELADSVVVVWGSADDSELKSQVAATLLAQVDASVYDVSAPTNPTTK